MNQPLGTPEVSEERFILDYMTLCKDLSEIIDMINVMTTKAFFFLKM